MTPVQRCLHKLDHAAAVNDTRVAENVTEALNELEAAYALPGERVVALEAVYQAFSRRGGSAATSPSGRFLLVSIDRRQSNIACRVA